MLSVQFQVTFIILPLLHHRQLPSSNRNSNVLFSWGVVYAVDRERGVKYPEFEADCVIVRGNYFSCSTHIVSSTNALLSLCVESSDGLWSLSLPPSLLCVYL